MGSVRDNMGRPGTPYDNAPDVTELDDLVLGAIEDMAAAQVETDRCATILRAEWARMMAFYLPAGTVIEKYRGFGVGLFVSRGNPGMAHKFRIVAPPVVEIDKRAPERSVWHGKATPLGKDDKPMKNDVSVRGQVFPRLLDGEFDGTAADRMMDALTAYQRDSASNERLPPNDFSTPQHNKE